MGTLTGNQILARVQKTLLDETGAQWTAAELLGYFAASFPAICRVKQDAYVKNQRLKLVEGTLQFLTEDAISLVRILRNAGENGLTPGRMISYVDLVELDSCVPDWHLHPQKSEVLQYAHDPRDPKRFYVYPPQDFPPGWVDAVVAAMPPRYDDLDDAIPIGDEFEDAIYYYTLANAYGKNSKRGDAAKFGAYMQMHLSALGLQQQAQNATTGGGSA